MEQVTFLVQKRDQVGKGAARKLRAAGQIPGVAYGRGVDPVPIAVDERQLLALEKHGANVLIDLKVDDAPSGASRLAILKELQRDPITLRPLSVDFQWISLTQRITVAVPIVLEGEPRGAESGGVLEHSIRELQVHVLPTEIPSSIPVSVAELDIGQSIHVRELDVPEGVEVLTPADEPVVTVSAPRAVEVVEEAPEEEVPEAEEEAAPEAAEAAEQPEAEESKET